MATMQDVIERAIRRMGVTDINLPVPVVDIAAALDPFNDMLHDWRNDLGSGYSHTTKALTATFPLEDRYIQGTAALLAFRLLDQNGKTISESLERDARRGWQALLAAYVSAPVASFDDALTTTPSQGFSNADFINDDDA